MKRITKKSMMTIMLDAGHGGRDAGGTVRNGKSVVVEKDFTLALAKQVGEKLTLLGHTVHYTRTEDTYPDLPARIVEVKKYNADLLISIHGDMITERKLLPYSSVVFHVKRDAERKLADTIAQNLEKSAGEKTRVFSDSNRAPTGLFILRNSPCKAAMIEIGDMIRASQPEKQTKIVDAIVQGVQKYLG
jgi:N-acetylmuramoyl-L-alanine amidase